MMVIPDLSLDLHEHQICSSLLLLKPEDWLGALVNASEMEIVLINPGSPVQHRVQPPPPTSVESASEA